MSEVVSGRTDAEACIGYSKNCVVKVNGNRNAAKFIRYSFMKYLIHPSLLSLPVFTLGVALLISSPVESAEAPEPDAESTPGALPREIVVIAGQIFDLELALTEETRTRGLMERNGIAADKGMLFVFPKEEELGFWMANTLVDLDIVFLDANGRVTATHRMRTEPPFNPVTETLDSYHARLPLYPSREPAQFAIEFKAGTLGLLRLKKGDGVSLDLPRLKSLATGR